MVTVRVCDCCHLLVATGERCQSHGHSPMTLLPGWWYSVGHGVPDDDCPDCKPETGDWCDRAVYESSPSWECPGCGNQPGMFFDMHLIERVADDHDTN